MSKFRNFLKRINSKRKKIPYRLIIRFVFLLLIIIPASVLYANSLPFLFNSLIDTKTDTTTISNLGFGFLAGVSALSFSWVRALDEKDKAFANEIRSAGEKAFMSSLFFLSASVLKYVLLKYYSNQESITSSIYKGILPTTVFEKGLGISMCFLFMLAIINFAGSIMTLFLILFKKVKWWTL